MSNGEFKFFIDNVQKLYDSNVSELTGDWKECKRLLISSNI
jgi:hypothetical protein